MTTEQNEQQERNTGHAATTSNKTLQLLRLRVQGRDGNFHELVMDNNDLQKHNDNITLLPRACSSADPLRLTAPLAEPTMLALAETFFGRSDAFNLVLTWLAPDDWMQLEGTCRRGSGAVVDSGCWFSPAVMAGHSLRFRPEARKAVYVRHRRAVARVGKAFQV